MAKESRNSRYDSPLMSKSNGGGDDGWTTREVEIGKGLSATLQLLRERGALNNNNIDDWGGRNVDKRKWSKFMGVDDDDDPKSEIRIDRRDEFGRIMTPKEAFRMISHKFHGIVPGKKKQEKRMKQYQQELKLKQMKINHSDTPSPSVERMREAQRQLKMPYLVLSGFVKPHDTTTGKGFANVAHKHELCRGGRKKLVPFLVKKQKRKAAEPKP